MSDSPMDSTPEAAAGSKAEWERAYKKAYRERNADHIREYRRRYREEHSEQVRTSSRAYRKRVVEEARRAKERAERRRVYSRQYYATHRDEIADSARRARARQKAADPERYLARRRSSNKRWRDKNRDAANAKLRAEYERDAPARREQARAYYYANRERILAQRKAARDADPDVIRDRQRRYRVGERRRREVGLPPYRIHRSTPAERTQHQKDANLFFARPLNREQIRVNRNGLATPTELIARWDRDSTRQRAEHFLATDADPHGMLRLTEVRRAARELERERVARRRAAEEAAEEARLDAIAKRINDRLRLGSQRPRVTHDPAAPHMPAGISPTAGGGLSR